jgi:hypothetical protein
MPRNDATDIDVSIRHLGFDAVAQTGERAFLGQDESKIYAKAPNWAAVFIQDKDDQAYGANHLLSLYLRIEHATLKDLIPRERLAEAKTTGVSVFKMDFPISISPGTFHFNCGATKIHLKQLTLSAEFSLTKQPSKKTSKTNLVKTDKPFAVFSIEADQDYLLARLISRCGIVFGGRVVYFGHQACEKYLKAIMVWAEGEYEEGHILHRLLKRCANINPIFDDPAIKRTLKIFDDFAEVGRYGATAKHDPHARKGITAGAWNWQSSHLHSLDHFVWTVRSFLDFRRLASQDRLSNILSNPKSPIVSEWKLDTPLRDILTKDNKFFT